MQEILEELPDLAVGNEQPVLQNLKRAGIANHGNLSDLKVGGFVGSSAPKNLEPLRGNFQTPGAFNAKSAGGSTATAGTG